MNKKIVLTLLVFLASVSLLFGQVQTIGNLYSTWAKLSITGKNQAEIEFFFSNIDEATLEKVKSRIRNAVINNLRHQGIPTRVLNTSDQDDIMNIRQKILIEVRYAGLEHDEDLQLAIKDEFGVIFGTL